MIFFKILNATCNNNVKTLGSFTAFKKLDILDLIFFLKLTNPYLYKKKNCTNNGFQISNFGILMQSHATIFNYSLLAILWKCLCHVVYWPSPGKGMLIIKTAVVLHVDWEMPDMVSFSPRPIRCSFKVKNGLNVFNLTLFFSLGFMNNSCSIPIGSFKRLRRFHQLCANAYI